MVVLADEPISQSMRPALPPPEDPSPEDADALFAKELNRLSMRERDHVLQDIHGVADIVDEEAEFVNNCLLQLEMELERLPRQNKNAYLQAYAKDAAYVSNRDFRLMFLRADAFNVRNTALRMVDFFEAKLELFGADKLAKTIAMDDLSKDDLRCLEAGYTQLLPERDRAGRAVIVVMPLWNNNHSRDCKVSRKLWKKANMAEYS